MAAITVRRTQQSRPVAWTGRWYRPAMLGLTLLLLAIAAAVWLVRYRTFDGLGFVGIDARTFVAFGERWLTTGSQYLPLQLAGPFDPQPLPPVPALLPSMYPPLAGPIFAAFTLAPILWWLPLIFLPVVIASWRPAPWTWPVIAFLLAWPHTSASIIVGGSVMWIALLLALGLRYRWPAALIVLKPTFGPLALIGVRERGWWLVVALEAVLTLVLLPEALRYLTVIGNAQGGSILYSMGDAPLMAIPLVAWAGRRR